MTLLETILLSARGARIAVDGATVIPGLDLVTRGERLLLLGAARPLIAALSGAPLGSGDDPPTVAAVIAGELRLDGADVATGAHRGVAGAAPLDPPLPPRWSLVEYLGWSARLEGVARRAADVLVQAVIERMALGALASRRLGTLAAVERRAAVLAAAIVREPRVVVIEDPFARLDAAEAPLMLGALARALEGRAAVISAGQLSLEHPSGELARSASDVCLLRDGALVLHADAATLLDHGRLYEVTIGRGAEALAAVAAANGWSLQGGPHHFSLQLPPQQGPTDVLRAAVAASASILRCVPVLG